MRVDANVSVRPPGTTEFGTRCEIKNLNSLRSLGRAIEYEADRQIDAASRPASGSRQETRHWDEDDGRTHTLRIEGGGRRLPLLPRARPRAARAGRGLAGRRRGRGPCPGPVGAGQWPLLDGDGYLPASRRDQVGTVVELGLDDLVVEAVGAGVPASLALSRTANEAATDAEAARRLSTSSYVGLLALEADGSLTATQAKAVLADMLAGRGDDPAVVAAAHGFEAMSADSLASVVAEVVAAHPDEWERFRAGGEKGDKLIGFFTGLVMRKTDKGADGKAVAAELRRLRG